MSWSSEVRRIYNWGGTSVPGTRKYEAFDCSSSVPARRFRFATGNVPNDRFVSATRDFAGFSEDEVDGTQPQYVNHFSYSFEVNEVAYSGAGTTFSDVPVIGETMPVQFIADNPEHHRLMTTGTRVFRTFFYCTISLVSITCLMLTVPELCRFFGIIIRMYVEVGGPHHLPHFHAYYQDDVAVVGLGPIDLIAGSLPRRQRRLVEAWAELHQQERIADWDRLQEGELPVPIAPLE